MPKSVTAWNDLSKITISNNMAKTTWVSATTETLAG